MTILQHMERRFDTSPPPLRTALDDHSTLLVTWWCSSFAAVIILFRVAGRYVRTERLFREDKVMFWSLIPLMARMGVIHVVLVYGTNNTETKGLTQGEVDQREIGSRLVLLARMLYAAL
jgi:hypothetical protein